MTVKRRIGGTSVTATKWTVQHQGAARPLKTAKVLRSGTLQTVFIAPTSGGGSGGGGGGFSASVSPTSATGYSRTSPVVSNSITITPFGGQAPYSYFWSIITDGGTITITSRTMATTSFRAVMPVGEYDGTAFCVVTDATGLTADVEVPVSLTRYP